MKSLFVAVVAIVFASSLGAQKNHSSVVTEGIIMSGSHTAPQEATILYSKTISGNRLLTLECKYPEYSFQDGTDCAGMLKQLPDGNEVYFNPKRIADRIIDPSIVAEVSEACAAMVRIDKSYRAGNPNNFVDSRGVLWQRKAEEGRGETMIALLLALAMQRFQALPIPEWEKRGPSYCYGDGKGHISSCVYLVLSERKLFGEMMMPIELDRTWEPLEPVVVIERNYTMMSVHAMAFPSSWNINSSSSVSVDIPASSLSIYYQPPDYKWPYEVELNRAWKCIENKHRTICTKKETQ